MLRHFLTFEKNIADLEGKIEDLIKPLIAEEETKKLAEIKNE